MNRVNENFLKLQNNYLFSTVAEKVEKYKQENPEKKVINLKIYMNKMVALYIV